MCVAGFIRACVLTEATACSRNGPEYSAVIVSNHGTENIGARSHGGGLEAHAPQPEPHTNARGPDDARLRLRRAFAASFLRHRLAQSRQIVEKKIHAISTNHTDDAYHHAGDHCRLRRRRPRRRVTREEPGPQDVRLVGRRRRRDLCPTEAACRQGVARLLGTRQRNVR